MTDSRRRTASALIALLFSLAALDGCGASKSSTRFTGDEYVALGDSYTAGPGITPYSDRACGRSRMNYPSMIAKALKFRSFSDRSCAGATTADLERSQTLRYAHLNDPQLDTVGRSTKLVTVGIGLNDDAISSGLLLVCLTPLGTEPTRACDNYLRQPLVSVEVQLEQAASNVEKALEKVAAKAPDAQIVLIGYPRLLPDTGSCPDRLPMPQAMLNRLRDAMRFAQDAWHQAARSARALYVDMYSASEGHDICSEDPWVNGAANKPGEAAAFHPYVGYHRAVSDAVISLLKH